MTDIETTLRRGLEMLAAETAAVVEPPPIGSIKARAHVARPRSRRWPRVAIAVGVTAVATAGAATAIGVLPDQVERTLAEFREWGFRADAGAELMASTSEGDLTYEIWRAPLDGGGQCVSQLVIGPGFDEDYHGGAACSGEPGPSPSPRPVGWIDAGYPSTVFDNSAGRDPESAPMHSTSWGRLPVGATKALFEFDDGTTLTVDAQRDGYFVTTFPGVRDGLAIVEIRAVDDAGTVLAAQPVSPP
jgi:hypothetical protein